jgi:stage V sporulation protein B
MTGLMCGTVSSLAPHLLRLAFPLDIAENGGQALRVLSLGMGSFSILGIICAALTSLKRERLSALLTAATVMLIAIACIVAVPQAAFGPAMLVSSATAASIALTASAAVGSVILLRVAGGFVAPLTVVRVVIAIAVTIVIGMRMPWMGKIAAIGQAAAMAAVYVAVLIVLREVGKADLQTVRSSLLRRK